MGQTNCQAAIELSFLFGAELATTMMENGSNKMPSSHRIVVFAGAEPRRLFPK